MIECSEERWLRPRVANFRWNMIHMAKARHGERYNWNHLRGEGVSFESSAIVSGALQNQFGYREYSVYCLPIQSMNSDSPEVVSCFHYVSALIEDDQLKETYDTTYSQFALILDELVVCRDEEARISRYSRLSEADNPNRGKAEILGDLNFSIMRTDQLLREHGLPGYDEFRDALIKNDYLLGVVR